MENNLKQARLVISWPSRKLACIYMFLIYTDHDKTDKSDGSKCEI